MTRNVAPTRSASAQRGAASPAPRSMSGNMKDSETPSELQPRLPWTLRRTKCGILVISVLSAILLAVVFLSGAPWKFRLQVGAFVAAFAVINLAVFLKFRTNNK